MPPQLPPSVPRIRLQPRARKSPLQKCRYATAVAAITPAPSIEKLTTSVPPLARYPPSQPPSHRPPEFRKSQLHRQYTSLLRSTPLMLLFQHNNLKSVEWMGIRRELTTALRKVDGSRAAEGRGDADLAEGIKVQIIQTGLFAAALRVVEYFRPDLQPQAQSHHPSDPATQSSKSIPNVRPSPDEPTFSHGLSRAAHDAVMNKKLTHALTPLLSGPLVAVTFPTVSPQHLKAVLSILSPSPPDFPAPSRRLNPGYHDRTVQSGIQKLLLLATRVEGKVFDVEGTKWVGSIEGGLDGLREQVVAMLSSVGAGLTNTLESAGRSLYLTVEGRRGMLEVEQKGPQDGSEGTPKEGPSKAP
ncbi:MAG: hypothetical protein M1830_004747 [Pleopsidium flavum]|nr:MAG: hypothetical protein M1830_004747 [Pleopsidium flavum]